MAAKITNLAHTEGPSAGAARERLPICESQLAKTWRRVMSKPPYPEGNLEAFIVRYWLFGPVAHELERWVDAGCPHVCGR